MKLLSTFYRHWPHLILAIALSGAVLLPTGAILAQSGGPYTITRFSIAGGGGHSSGGSYSLTGFIGIAGEATAGGGGGSENIYLPIILK